MLKKIIFTEFRFIFPALVILIHPMALEFGIQNFGSILVARCSVDRTFGCCWVFLVYRLRLLHLSDFIHHGAPLQHHV